LLGGRFVAIDVFSFVIAVFFGVAEPTFVGFAVGFFAVAFFAAGFAFVFGVAFFAVGFFVTGFFVAMIILLKKFIYVCLCKH
jgi:hypothetical protein